MADVAIGRPIEILLVEDAIGDVELTLEALEEGRIANRVEVAADGEVAMKYLERSLAGTVPRPDLILLDLNLPRLDGREVLEELKRRPEFLRIPVIVLTSSKAQEDILRAYDLHANSYVTKPVIADEFIRAVRGLKDYWLTIVRLPPR
jgi:CheY-like chemotaxis protein